MHNASLVRWLDEYDPAARAHLLKALEKNERNLVVHDWPIWRRADQTAPPGDWQCWLICAGRGFGKTRAGAEWVREQATNDPEARIALVGASLGEVRAVMVEGESGVLSVCHPRHRPHYEPSLRRMTWPNGAVATMYSAAEAESLRGPQHSHAWCDEIAKWTNAGGRAEAAWDNLMMGLRLGLQPRVVATTTPRATPLMRRLMDETQAGGHIALTRGSTFANRAHLPRAFLARMERDYGGTTLGRQELEADWLEDIEGALWSRSLLERCRHDDLREVPDAPTRVVVGVDPPVSAHGDECGIVVCGRTPEGTGQVIADASLGGATPERWARAVADTAALWDADRVIAEANQGGAMVESVLRAAAVSLPVKLVHASRGKSARAEPVAALYEAGRVHHLGMFARLEDQLCGLMTGGGYEGPGRSPDRADALVWALSELMLGKRPTPRVRPM